MLAVLTAVVVLLFFPPYFAGYAQHWAAGTYGVQISRDGSVQIASVQRGSPAWQAGIRPGDRVLGALGSAQMLRLAWPRAGQVQMVRFRHSNGPVRRARVQAVPAAPVTPWEWAVTALGIAVLLVFLGIATMLVYARPGVMTWSFYAYAVGFFPTTGAMAFYSGLLPEPLMFALFFVLSTLLGNIVAMPLLPFVVRFPGGLARGWRKPVDRAIWVAIVLAFAAYSYQFFHARLTGEPLPWGQALNEWLPLAVFAAAAVILIKNYKEFDAAARQRSAFLIAGALMSFVGYAVYFIPGVDPVVQTLVSYLAVLLPITVAYAVLRHRVLDINFVLNRALAYGALSVIVIVAVTLIDWLSSQIVSKAHFTAFLEIVVTIGVGFFLTRINGLLERGIDVLLFRRRHEAERYLARVAEALPYATEEDAISDGLVREPVRALALSAGALYRRSEDGRRYNGVATSHDTLVAPMGFERNHALVRFLQSSESVVWLDDVRAQLDPENSAVYVLAVPVNVRHEVVAFVLYGAHANGAQIDPDEVSLLEQLAREAARAYDHVEAIRVRELLVRFTALPAGTP